MFVDYCNAESGFMNQGACECTLRAKKVQKVGNDQHVKQFRRVRAFDDVTNATSPSAELVVRGEGEGCFSISFYDSCKTAPHSLS